jgi:diguanylate cyclase (GGDEF)-like protein/PAS domain S-box-containing protein
MTNPDMSFDALFLAHPAPMWVYDLESLRFMAVNAAAIVHYGFTEAEFLGMTIRDIRPPEELIRLNANLQQPLQESIEKSGVWRHLKKDGSIIDVEITSHPLRFADRDCKFVLAHDVTERLLAQRKVIRLSRIYAVSSGINAAIARIHNLEDLFGAVCSIAVHDGAFGIAWIARVDPATLEGKVVASCGAAKDMLDRLRVTGHPGRPESARPACVAIREQRPVICNNIANEPTLAEFAHESLQAGHHAVAALPLMTEGRVAAVMVLVADARSFFDAEEIKLLDDVVGDLEYALQFIDNEQRLSYLAYYDSLTGLANGKLFEDRLTQALHTAQPEHRVATVVLNIDRFSELNDALGRRMGDALLKLVASRLGNALPAGASLARIGGATFALAFDTLPDDAHIGQMVVDAITAPVNQGFQLDGHDLRLSVRAGIAIFPADGSDAETLIKHAKAALKYARSGNEAYLYYSPEMNAAHASRLALESELKRAIDAREFVVHFQPRVDLASGHIVSAEALIRWNHPQRGLVMPGTFIPLAEEVGLIEPIGDWVLETVCAQQSIWLQRQLDVVPVAVNLSAGQFKNGKVLQTIADALARYQLQPLHVEFELTESMVMREPETAAHILKALQKMGCQLSLDDFGTGYSSLAYLQRFPFDVVKIDRAFITDVNSNPGNAAIATAVIAMAHSLKLRVVAEGGETEGQLQFSRERRCDEIQGYLFSPAVPALEFETMLSEKKRLVPMQQAEEGAKRIADADTNGHVSHGRLH